MNAVAPLWKIEDELVTLVDSLDTCPDQLKPELEARIAVYVGTEMEKIDRVAAVLSSLEGVQATAKAEIERLRARQQSAERASKRLEGYILHVLRRRDGQPLKGRNVTFSIRRSDALVITDPEAVPNEWKRTTVTIDIPKDPLKRALKTGQDVPGVTIQYGEHLVRK